MGIWSYYMLGRRGHFHFCATEELSVKTLIEGIIYFVCPKWFSTEQERRKKEQRILRGSLAFPFPDSKALQYVFELRFIKERT